MLVLCFFESIESNVILCEKAGNVLFNCSALGNMKFGVAIFSLRETCREDGEDRLDTSFKKVRLSGKSGCQPSGRIHLLASLGMFRWALYHFESICREPCISSVNLRIRMRLSNRSGNNPSVSHNHAHS